jgi:hypothetical protein
MGAGFGWVWRGVVHGSLTLPDPAPILRRRAVYGRWIRVGVAWGVVW